MCNVWEIILEKSYQFANTLQDHINDLLANSVVATGIVISCILLPRDELFWVEELLICATPHLICNLQFYFYIYNIHDTLIQ